MYAGHCTIIIICNITNSQQSCIRYSIDIYLDSPLIVSCAKDDEMFLVPSLTVHLYLPASDTARFGMTSKDELTPKARFVIVWFSISQ